MTQAIKDKIISAIGLDEVKKFIVAIENCIEKDAVEFKDICIKTVIEQLSALDLDKDKDLIKFVLQLIVDHAPIPVEYKYIAKLILMFLK